MILDFLNQFTGGTTAPGNSDNATDSPTTGTQTSSLVVDLGVGLQTTTNPSGVGIPSAAAGAGARDLGVGDHPSIKIMVEVTTAFASGTSLAINIQGAPDSGTGTQGTYTTYVSGPVIAEAALVAGARLLEIDLPRPPAGVALPRYLRLQYVTVGTHTAGAIRGNAVLDRFDQVGSQTGVLSGYPAGVTVAN